MSQLGPVVLVGSGESTALADQLAKSGAFPIVGVPGEDAASAVAEVRPSAVVVDLAGVGSVPLAALVEVCGQAQLYTPLIAVGPLEGPSGDARPHEAMRFTTPELPLQQLDARLGAALRVRALHATVLRRLSDTGSEVQIPAGDPLHDATVLLVGRGRSYPALTIAFGERVGLIGALSIEAAAKQLNARNVDGIVLGDGFSHRVADAFLTVLTEDARFRGLPMIVSGSFAGGTAPALPNLEITRGSPELIATHAVPLVRQRAFEIRLMRVLKSLDAGGVIDPTTGLLTVEAFDRNWHKAISETINNGGALSAARFSFDGADARARRDAARLLGRLMRGADFAALRDDNSIVAAFAETSLHEAHVIARRLASVMRQTAFGPSSKNRVDPLVRLVTVKPDDTAESLLARLC